MYFDRNSQSYLPYKGCSCLKVNIFIVFHLTSAFMMILIEDLEKVWAALAQRESLWDLFSAIIVVFIDRESAARGP